MKKTKIICTLGPTSETKETIAAMADAGMNVARINFSHGTHEQHAEKIKTIKAVRDEKKIPLPIMLDTKGPEFRIKTFKDGKITLNAGDPFTFTTENVEGDQERVSVSFAAICEELNPGDKILLNNGLIVFRVVSIENTNARYLEKGFLPPCDLAVMDVSFISQTKLYNSVTNVLKDNGIFISLIKPQFEAGKSALNKKGIVKDDKIIDDVVKNIIFQAGLFGLRNVGVTNSPILGGDGNRELLACFKYEKE